MGTIKQLLYPFVKQIMRDGMLLVLIPAPFLMGIIFRYLLPLVNTYVESQHAVSIEPYYIFADLMLVSITPLLGAMISAFILLDERDEGVALYYQITPAKGTLYLLSRLLFCAVFSFVATITVMFLFNHVIDHLSITLLITLISTLQGIVMASLIVKFSSNKVEGLAVAKLMGFLILGFLPAYLIASPAKYLFVILPSFWIGEIVRALYGGI